MSQQPKSYGTRGRAEPHNSQVYSAMLTKMGLKMDDHSALTKRGLTGEQIKAAGYSTKGHWNSKELVDTVAYMLSNFNVEGVPGFCIDDKTGSWTVMNCRGLTIPCRDIDGNIASLLIRNVDAKPNPKTGRIHNKYVQFSTAGKTKGTKTRQTTHCPIIKGPAKDVAGTTVRLTEGVLKADVATAKGSLYCIGNQGLNVREDLEIILDELEVSIVHICLDAGEDDNIDMIRAKAALILRLRQMGLEVQVETWDPALGKGIDDVITGGHEDKIVLLTKEELDASLEKANVNDPNSGEWVYVVGQQAFYNVVNGLILEKAQFADKFRMLGTKEINELIQMGFKQVDKLNYLPKAPMIFKDGLGVSCLNLWQDPKLEVAEGDIDIFLKHMEYLFPDTEDGEGQSQRNLYIDFMAHIVKFSGKKIRWSLVVQGDEGVGKSFTAELMKKLLGESNVSTPMMEVIHDKYTDWQSHCQLVVIEELMASGKMELMNKMKPFIVSDVTEIREMYRKPYKQPNLYNIISFTNYEDPIIINEKDRRYGVIRTFALPKDKDYYTTLFDWIEVPENLSAMLHFFQTRDLSALNTQRAPMTQAKRAVIAASRNPLEEWISRQIEENAWPFNNKLVSIRHLRESKDIGPHFGRFGDYRWAQALKAAGCTKTEGQTYLADKSRTTLWIVKGHEGILGQMSNPELAKLFDAASLDREPGGKVEPFEANRPL